MRGPNIVYLQGRVARRWALGGAGGCLLLIVLGWFFVVSPARSHVSSVKAQTAGVQATNDSLRAKIAGLQVQNNKIDQIRQSLAADRAQLPVDSGLTALTRQLQTQATTAHVTLNSITAGVPSVAGSAALTTGTAATAGNSAGAAVGSTYQIPMTLVTAGNLVNQRVMLNLLQRTGPRLALVTSVSYSSSDTASIDEAVTMTVQFEIFLTPQTPAQVAALTQQLKALSGQSGH